MPLYCELEEGLFTKEIQLLKVATIQCESRNGEPLENLKRAGALVEQAVNLGAKLLLCAEFLATGYAYENSIWKAAEPSNGITVNWLRRLAASHSIYIGATFLELSDGNFYNTFVLFGPEGTEMGRVRKTRLPFFEPYFYKPGTNTHILKTPLGNIGIGICYENHLRSLVEEFSEGEIDLILMPHSAPDFSHLPFVAESIADSLKEIAPHYAKLFGVPVLMTNKVGVVQTTVPFMPYYKSRLRFPGWSTICDANGKVVNRLGSDAGVGVVEISLYGKRANPKPSNRKGKWALPLGMAAELGAPFSSFMEFIGRLTYRLSLRRRLAAKRVNEIAALT